MRAVTFSDKKVSQILRRNFVCGWDNISESKSYAGKSNSHMPSNSAVTVSNCSGHHNVQMFFMTPDAHIVNCLPGFWDVKSFLMEVQLASKLNKLYKSTRSIVKRNDKFLDIHLEFAFFNHKSLSGKSQLQKFDEMNLNRREETDFQRMDGFVSSGFKTADQVVHERMAERPFLKYEEFDVPSFIDMGRKKYSYDFGLSSQKGKRTEKSGKR